MGGVLALTPRTVLAIDLGLLLAVLSTHARQRRWGWWRALIGVATGAALVALASLLSLNASGPAPGLDGARMLDGDRAGWVGKPVAETSLACWLSPVRLPGTGIVIITRSENPAHAALLARARQGISRHLPALIIDVPRQESPGTQTHAALLPHRITDAGGDVQLCHLEFPLGDLLTLPAIIEVVEGRVRSVR